MVQTCLQIFLRITFFVKLFFHYSSPNVFSLWTYQLITVCAVIIHRPILIFWVSSCIALFNINMLYPCLKQKKVDDNVDMLAHTEKKIVSYKYTTHIQTKLMCLLNTLFCMSHTKKRLLYKNTHISPIIVCPYSYILSKKKIDNQGRLHKKNAPPCSQTVTMFMDDCTHDTTRVLTQYFYFYKDNLNRR